MTARGSERGHDCKTKNNVCGECFFFVCVAGHSDVCFYLVTARFTVAIVDVHVSKEELV